MSKFKVVFNREKCKGCELCCTYCPKDLIEMDPHVNAKGYSPAMITRQEECVGCKSCALVCPDGAIEIFSEEE